MTDPILLLGIGAAFALIPIAAGLFTAYLKVSIVLGILRQAFGTAQGIGAAVTFALSMVMTLLIMESTVSQSLKEAEKVEFSNIKQAKLSEIATRITPILLPWKLFMEKHTGEREFLVVQKIRERTNNSQIPSDAVPKEKIEEKPLALLISAFVLTEIKEACRMAFLLLIPFMVIDMVVANVLVGLGMHMVSPTVIALPLKLLLFVGVDGWLMLTKSIVESYV